MCVRLCFGEEEKKKSAGALSRESNAKIVLVACHIIHDSSSEVITVQPDMSSLCSMSPSLMNLVLFKMSARVEICKEVWLQLAVFSYCSQFKIKNLLYWKVY